LSVDKRMSTEIDNNSVNDIENSINEKDEYQLMDYLDTCYHQWVLPGNTNIGVYLERCMENYSLVHGQPISFEEFQTKYKKWVYNIIYLSIAIGKKLSYDSRFEDTKLTFNKIFESIDYSAKIIKMGTLIINSHSQDSIEIKDDLGILRFSEINTERNSPFQNLLLFLLDSIYTNNLQRYQGSLYEKVYHFGYFTHSWKEKMSIKKFIYENTQFCTNYQQWHNVTSNSGNIKNAIEFLENCKDPRINDLKKDRHVFAFNNGIYTCKEWDQEHSSWVDHFYEYGSKEKIGDSVVASKFFDCSFNNFEDIDDFYDIPTPYLQSIFDYQGLSEEVCRWIYAFLGRLFFNLGELDNWQVALFLEGVAGSGKSTITKIVKKFYDVSDVGVLSNNIEKKFGLAPLKDKLLFLAPEIKSDLGLEQSEFQLLIEGGDMQLPVKFKDSEYTEWKTPGLFAGNEPPDYTDNSGSISRRLVVVKFVKKVSNKDSCLDAKLDSELPAIIKKTASAYLSAVREHSGKDFWSSLPEYFRDTQRDMAQSTHSLEHFINSGKVLIGEEYYCREKNFVQAFNEHCKECHLERHKFTTDYYLGVFGNHSITIKKNLKLKYPNSPGGKTYQGTFIFGLDIVNDSGEDNLDDF